MVSKLAVGVLLILGLGMVGCGSSSDDEVVIEGPKATDLKEAGVATQGTVESAPAKPTRAPGPPTRNR